MKYENMKKKSFAHGYVKDGFCGDLCNVFYALNNFRVYVIHKHGYYWSGIMADSISQAKERINESGYCFLN